jgi:hypothetical protein
MSDITVTAASVRPLEGARIIRKEAGGTIAVGAAVYVDSNGDIQATDGDAIETTMPCIGLLVAVGSAGAAAAADGDTCDVCVEGPVTGFASMTPGTLCYVSGTAGLLATTVTDNGFIVGFAESASTVFVRPETIHLTEQG